MHWLGNIQRWWHSRRRVGKKDCSELADNRLELLRKIIELAYLHEHHKNIFYSKVCELVNIAELKRHPIVDFEAYCKHHSKSPLGKDDSEFHCLLEAGFTLKELGVIYGHSNPISIYVKKHRIMSKLKSVPEDK